VREAPDCAGNASIRGARIGGRVCRRRLIMTAIFALFFYLLFLPLVFAHEHTNAVPEIDRKFLDHLQRPDNRPNERIDEKSKSCCTDKDAVSVEYKMVVLEGAKYPEPE